MITNMIRVYVLISFYDENGLHKAGSVTLVKEEDFNPLYMKAIPAPPTVDAYTKEETNALLNTKQDTLTAGTGITISNNVISAEGGSGSVIDNIQLTEDDQVDSMDIDNNTYYFSTVGQVGVNSEGKVTSVVLNDSEQEFTSIDNVQVDSEYCTKSFDLNGDTVSFTSIENISTQGPNGEVDSMDINGTNYTFATGGGGAAELNDLDDVNITNVDNADILSFDAINREWINIHSDGYKIYCEGNDAPKNFSNTQLTDVRFTRSGSSLTPQDVDRAITRVSTYGAAMCLTYIFMNNYYTYAFKCIDKDKNVIFESEIFDNNGTKYVSQIVFSFDHQGLYAVGNTFALSSGGGGSALIVTLTGATGATVDLMNMSARSSVNVNANKTYAEIKAADEIIFKITDNVSSGGARWTFRPVGMYTLDVQADQALVFTFSAYAANQNLKEFRLEISPWGTFFTLYCMA